MQESLTTFDYMHVCNASTVIGIIIYFVFRFIAE